jgi:D-tagatose-1,6-bisphosphate aldolase subunit GatZ/KbaZ
MYSPLDEIVHTQKRGHAIGIPSICSAHPWVLRAAMQRETVPLLIESTCNQVNQFGGYTGMTPDVYAGYIRALAVENDYPVENLILGGDHLGPSVWRNEPAEGAMRKSEHLVQACVRAGYRKIHLDASMKLRDDDPTQPLDVELVARRTVRLAKAAEYACPDTDIGGKLRYVIGSEVPPPGGATAHEEVLRVTEVKDVRRMLEITQAEFLRQGLGPAWGKVVAIVVQPGVEFGDDFVLDYKPEAAHDLKLFAETVPFIYEAHSTDYQTAESLRSLVRDHFAILKVGPALTFAFREAVFGLAMIENELFSSDQRSLLIDKLDDAMLREPDHWISHYHGTEIEVASARKYSLSDRVRYYWAQPDVQAALHLLIKNFSGKPLPLSLLSQYFPHHYALIRQGGLENTVEAIIIESISRVLRDYVHACEPLSGNT